MTMQTSFRLSRSRRSVLFAFLAAFLLLACDDGGASAGSSTASVGKGKAPHFRLKTLDGRTLGPKDFPGKVVVVDFWATWCAPCHEQTRILEPIYREYKGRGVQFLATNVAEEEATVRKFLQRKPLPYPVLMDPGDVSGDLGVYALPTLIVIDKKGKISFFHQGVVDDATLRQALKQAGA
jgi:thiol-disulfide isomerase/thioredoxin